MLIKLMSTFEISQDRLNILSAHEGLAVKVGHSILGILPTRSQ
jgi:hypothetical protein